MEQLTWILIGISALFFFLLILKNLFNIKKFCPLCLAVSLTWIVLLILTYLEIFSDRVVIAILMGMTSLGIYQLLENKVNAKLLIFRLPYILTAILVVYSILENLVISTLYFVLVVWVIFLIIYFFRFNKLANKLIECCKKW